MSELYTTLGQSSLDGAITAGALTLDVVSGASFPSFAPGGNFRIRIEDEIILVGSHLVPGTFSSLTRGIEGTAAAAHATAQRVTEVLTAGAIDAIRVDVHETGLVGALPNAPRAGDTFYPSNSLYELRYTGAAWERWGAIWKLTEPVNGDFAWRNQGTASVSVANGGVYLKALAAAGSNTKGREIVAPATPYTITAAFLANLRALDFTSCGLYFANNAAGTLSRLGITANSTILAGSGFILQADKMTSAVLFSALYAFEPFGLGRSGLIWFRIADDGVNRIYSVSSDGYNFLTFFSVARADFLTADRVGFYAESGQATSDAGITLLHFAVA